MRRSERRSKWYAGLAMRRVKEVNGFEGSGPESTKARYQKLCQSFPVMVRQSGLMQSLAFSAAKAEKDEGLPQAHKRILGDVAAILNESEGELLEAVQIADAPDYIRKTQAVLEAWVYFKRFSKSLLDVEEE